MADDEQVFMLTESGSRAWNRWRAGNTSVDIDLTGANLRGADLRHANLANTNLAEAELVQADLRWSDLSAADLSKANAPYVDLRAATVRGATLTACELLDANLREVDLTSSDLSNSDLRGANLTGGQLRSTNLSNANLTGAELRGADLRDTNWLGARLGNTDLAGANLAGAAGLEACDHAGPCVLDHRAITLAKTLPESFLRGCGWPEALVAFAPILCTEPASRLNYVVISHASGDRDFASRLRDDLTAKGMRCWMAADDTAPGDIIGAAAHAVDRIILVLSQHTMASTWAETEVVAALAVEGREQARVLWPVSLDEAMADATAQWARDLADARPATDFSKWRDDSGYTQALEHLLAELSGDS